MISHATTPRLASSLSRPLLRSPPAVAVAPLLGARAYASSNNGNKMSRDHTSLGGSYISASDSLAAAGATRTHASMGLAGAPAGEGPPAPHTIGDAIIADHKRCDGAGAAARGRRACEPPDPGRCACPTPCLSISSCTLAGTNQGSLVPTSRPATETRR